MRTGDASRNSVVNDTKITSRRGRPRTFDREQALLLACDLFHARGYDALSVADLTSAMGVNPPSFYAAFGSKLELYAEALRCYRDNDGLDVGAALAPGASLADGLANLFCRAADAYAKGNGLGCMVIEGARGAADLQARGEARAILDASREAIHQSLVAMAPAHADLAADYVMVTLAGLSAGACSGLSRDRLRQLGKIAASGFAASLNNPE